MPTYCCPAHRQAAFRDRHPTAIRQHPDFRARVDAAEAPLRALLAELAERIEGIEAALGLGASQQLTDRIGTGATPRGEKESAS